jgi:hypothetical protein
VREGDLQMEQEGSDPGEQQARGYSFLAYYPGTLSPEPHPSYFLLYFSATVSHFFFFCSRPASDHSPPIHALQYLIL